MHPRVCRCGILARVGTWNLPLPLRGGMLILGVMMAMFTALTRRQATLSGITRLINTFRNLTPPKSQPCHRPRRWQADASSLVMKGVTFIALIVVMGIKSGILRQEGLLP